MHYSSIRSHLKPYVIVARRKSTISHAFAAAIAPSDSYSEIQVRAAMTELAMSPDEDLMCAYCGVKAQTWDHVYATVRNTHFSGFGHRLGNLLPCCKSCNSSKGNKDWDRFLNGLALSPDLHLARRTRITAHLARYFVQDVIPDHLPEYKQLLEIKRQVMELLAQADELAKIIRGQVVLQPSLPPSTDMNADSP